MVGCILLNSSLLINSFFCYNVQMTQDEKQRSGELSEEDLSLLIQEAYGILSKSEALQDGTPEKETGQQRAFEIFEDVNRAVIANPRLLKTAWEKMAEQGYIGDAYDLALLTARDGRTMGEDELCEHVKAVVTEMIQKDPTGWNLEQSMREIEISTLNQRHNKKMKLAGQVPSPEVYGTIEEIKAGIQLLLKEDGVVEPERFENEILSFYETKMIEHWKKARDEGKGKEFVEKFPTGTRTNLWEKYYLYYVRLLFKKNTEGEDLRWGLEIIAPKKAFERFAPEVLAAMAAGKIAEDRPGKTRRDKLGSPDNWNAEEKAEIVRRVVESSAIKDSLALLDVMDLPLPMAEKYRVEFYTAYSRRDPKKITANAEFFEPQIRESGKPQDALDFLNSRKHLDLESLESIKIPTEAEVENRSAEEVLKMVLENHDFLLQKMKKLGPKNLPFYGLSGGAKPDIFLSRAASNEKVYLQFVTNLEGMDDPNLALLDLYDNVGGDRDYFAGEAYGLFIMDIEEEGTERLSDYWGADGEFKNWNINVVFSDKPLDSVRDTGVTLSPEQVQFLRFFQATKEKKIRPHAEKTSRTFRAGTSREELKKRLIAHVNADDTPLYLLKKDFRLRIDAPDTPERSKRQLLTEIIYVQFVADKVLDAFMVPRIAA